MRKKVLLDKKVVLALAIILVSISISFAQQDSLYRFVAQGNPIITHKYTADPAAIVAGDQLWLYTGRDFAGGQKGYVMQDWCVFSTRDLKNWTEYPTPLKITDFAWAKGGKAYAAHTIERDGKYYWYVSTEKPGIGVAVADRPEGPFRDAIGKPLVTREDCFASSHSWVCIDPAVFIDDDGQAWMFWGNRECYYVKLKRNMVEIDGEIKQLKFEGFDFTEAPWIHKKNGKYYLTYATGFPEKIAYAMADNIEGPYVYKGILNEIAGNSNTNHQAIVEFKGESYFIYHNGGIQTDGGSYSRSVCIDRLFYNPDGTLRRVQMTTEGAVREHSTDYAAYLFAYFTGGDEGEAIRFAVSDDGYNYKALNGNKPIFDSKKISSAGGIRDPHILRAEDGKTFYMVATDMMASKGWDSNRAMVLFKSADLINWSSSIVNIQNKYPNQDSLKRVWAPQTIYDPEVGKYMVYWSMKHGDKGHDIIYYSYANADFTDLVDEPKVLFMPQNGLSCIDGDIIFKDGLYHMFYKTEGHGNGIKVATTNSLSSGKWQEAADYKQQTKQAVEGSSIFKLIGQDKYILHYDVYRDRSYQFTESTDLDTFRIIDNAISMDFKPRHGSIIAITRTELENLLEKWGKPEKEIR